MSLFKYKYCQIRLILSELCDLPGEYEETFSSAQYYIVFRGIYIKFNYSIESFITFRYHYVFKYS